MTAYDYIIVGGGSAGCVLAHRLTETWDARVLLLEAGGGDGGLYIRMPAGFAFATKNPRYDWGYRSEPEPGLLDRQIPCPRGRVIGGSSSINALAFVRGHRRDFDRWAELVGSIWSYENCLPYFRKIERFSGGSNEYRGDSGLLTVIAPAHENPLYGGFLAACAEAGYATNIDANGADQEGFGPMDQTIDCGNRASAATAYLAPAEKRPNLTVRRNAMVTRVVLEGKCATAVDVIENGSKTSYEATTEIILAAGAVNSPHLLMLSGIGPAEDLKKAGIDCLLNLPGVGQNLQDHVDATLRQTCRQSVSESPQLRTHRKALIGLQWLLFRNGAGATNHFEVAGYIRTSHSLPQPDIQLVFIPLLVTYDGSPPDQTPHGFQVSIMGLQPQSRGSVAIASSNPMTPPRLSFNYLQEHSDVRTICDGLAALRVILAQDSMRPYCGPEIAPGDGIRDADAIERFIRATAKSTHHLCGTCKMGTDDEAVVDASGRVHGLGGLRIADASIMPTITSGNTNAPTLMLAERIADIILDGV